MFVRAAGAVLALGGVETKLSLFLAAATAEGRRLEEEGFGEQSTHFPTRIFPHLEHLEGGGGAAFAREEAVPD